MSEFTTNDDSERIKNTARCLTSVGVTNWPDSLGSTPGPSEVSRWLEELRSRRGESPLAYTDDRADATRFGAGVMTALGATLLCVLGWVVFHG